MVVPVAVKLVTKSFRITELRKKTLVEVELVIVPLVVLIEGKIKLVTDRFVIVAEVSVALVPSKLSVIVVVELVVEAKIL